MTAFITSTLSSKAQLTLPKEVRDILGVKSKGDLVGFMVDKEAKSVRLARVDAVLADPEFTAEEYGKLLKLRGGKGRKFETMAAFLKDLKSKA